MANRVFTQERLAYLHDKSGMPVLDEDGNKIKRTKLQLQTMLDMVKGSNDLSRDEIEQNVKEIEFLLNGGASKRREDILRDIEAGSADIDDMGGY